MVTGGRRPTDVVMVLKDSTIRSGADMNGKLIDPGGLMPAIKKQEKAAD